MITAIIEMPKNTRFKYEVCKSSGRLILDRPVKVDVPHNYGFIPNTLCEDGDPIDVFIASLEAVPPLTQVTIELVGLIDCIDKDKHDPKLLAYIVGDELGRQLINQTEFLYQCIQYLTDYKVGLSIETKDLSIEKSMNEFNNSVKYFEHNKLWNLNEN